MQHGTSYKITDVTLALEDNKLLLEHQEQLVLSQGRCKMAESQHIVENMNIEKDITALTQEVKVLKDLVNNIAIEKWKAIKIRGGAEPGLQ